MKKINKIIILCLILLFSVCCNTKEEEKLNGGYNGVLICQHAAISSWITNFDIQIKDNLLLMNNQEIGLLEKKELKSNKWSTEFMHIEKEHTILFDNLKEIKECYSVYINDSYNENDFGYSAMVIDYLNEKYLIIASLNQDKVYEVIKGYYLSNEAILEFTDYPGGCIVLNHIEKVKMGSIYNLSKVEELLGVSTYIDLNTLEFYQGEFVVTKNLNLVTYKNGVYDVYIKRYLNNKSTLMHIFGHYSLQLLEDYGCTKKDDGDIVVVKDDITYLYKKSEQLKDRYYLANVKGQKLFENLSYQETIDILKILYGSEDFNKYLISININENSFEIDLKEEALNG